MGTPQKGLLSVQDILIYMAAEGLWLKDNSSDFEFLITLQDSSILVCLGFDQPIDYSLSPTEWQFIDR